LVVIQSYNQKYLVHSTHLKAGFPLLSAAFGSQNYLPTTDYTHTGSFLSFLSIPIHISLPSWSSTRRGLPTGVLRTTSTAGGSSPPWPHRHVGAAPPRPGRCAGTDLRQPVTPGFKDKPECKNTCAPGSSYTHASTQ
jgi:hypothetical protein